MLTEDPQKRTQVLAAVGSHQGHERLRRHTDGNCYAHTAIAHVQAQEAFKRRALLVD
ncbi:hypothetical protein ACPOL_3914 [Acidisarcina polymorpha]|uniref:Uncharacterized protein n=1 Tax=Acidisarcina polymorpha TaxID=2211140 RepID=A0A2Z5G1Z5_9BACT|nr:hypothetical protein ACPOL_3914 [Acidisarcina polymorpha]